MVALFDMLIFFLLGLGAGFLLWPVVGVWAGVIVAPAFIYPLRALFSADKLVARRAGFRPPSLLQSRYLNFLNINCEVWTHPSLAVAAGVLASKDRFLVVMTAGALRYLHDSEIKMLADKLTVRNHSSVFNWTYHMATAGMAVFSVTPNYDLTSQWLRLIVLTVAGMAVSITFFVGFFVGGLTGSSSFLALTAVGVLPPILGIAWFVWKHGAMSVSKLAANAWNTPLAMNGMTFSPMPKPIGGFSKLHLLKDGLLQVDKIPEYRDEELVDNALEQVFY